MKNHIKLLAVALSVAAFSGATNLKMPVSSCASCVSYNLSKPKDKRSFEIQLNKDEVNSEATQEVVATETEIDETSTEEIGETSTEEIGETSTEEIGETSTEIDGISLVSTENIMQKDDASVNETKTESLVV